MAIAFAVNSGVGRLRMKMRSVTKLAYFSLVVVILVLCMSEVSRSQLNGIRVPSSYRLQDSIYFHVEYIDGQVYSAYRVFATDTGSHLSGEAVGVYFHLSRLHNWLIVDHNGELLRDNTYCQDIALAADTAYRVHWSESIGYSGRVPSNLWIPQTMRDKADEWTQIILITYALDFLQAVGNVAGAGITTVLSGGYSEAVKLPVREALKRVAKEIVEQAIIEYAKSEVTTTEGAYKNVLRARAGIAAAVLHAEAGKNITIELGDTVDFEEMEDFRQAVAEAMAMGEGAIRGLYQFYDGGPCQYFMGVIESADPTGLVDSIEDWILTDSSLADAMDAVATEGALVEAQDAGLLTGALEVRDAFLNANRVLLMQIATDKGTYNSNELLSLNVLSRDQDNSPIDAELVSFSVMNASGATKLQRDCEHTGTTGAYSAQFSAADLGAAGEFTIEATAVLSGYLEGQGSCAVTITQGAFLSTDPASYDIALARSAHHSDSITVSNTTSAPTSVSVDASGGVASWITLSEISFSLDGFSSKELHFTIDVPSGANEGQDYSGGFVLSYDEVSLNVPVLMRVTAQGDELTSSATIDGDFAPESPGQYNPRALLIDHRNYTLTDQDGPSSRHDCSFNLTTDEMDRLIMLQNYCEIDKIYEAPETSHPLAFVFNGEEIWELNRSEINERRWLTSSARAGSNTSRYAIWSFVHGAGDIEYLIDTHQFTGWFSRQAWGGSRSYSQATLDSWRTGWHYGKLEVQVITVYEPGRLFFFLNGEPVAYRGVSASDAGQKIYFPMFRDKAGLLSTSNRFNLKGCAAFGNSIDWGNHAKVDLGPIQFSVTHFSGQPDVRVQKAVEPAEVFVGDTATVTITLTNLGSNVACGADFHDSLPNGLELVGGSLTGGESLTPSESASFTYTVKGNTAQQYTLPAVQVSYENPLDDNFTSISSPASLLVKAHQQLNQLSGLNKSEYSGGEMATLTVTVADNTGASVDGVNVSWRVMSGANTIINSSFQTGSNGTGSDTFDVPTTSNSYTVEVIASKTDYISDSGSTVFAVVDSLPPTVPMPLQPSQGAYVNEATPQLGWMLSIDVGAGLSHYVVQIDVDQNFTTPIESIANSTYYNPTNNLSDGTYYWRVKSVDMSQNESDWSEISFFFVDTIPPTITDVDPADGQQSVAVDTRIRVTFSEPMHHRLTESAFALTPATEGSFEWESDTLIFTPTVNLEANSSYNISITDGSSDLAFNRLVNTFISTFETGSGNPSALSISSTYGGSVTNPGEGLFPYDDGTVVSIEATADDYYYFVNWTGTAVDAGKAANPNAASTTVTVDSSYAVQANFATDLHNLTISSTSGGTVTTPGEGTYAYDHGTTASVVAAPSANYHFVNWTGDFSGSSNPATIIMDSDMSVTANFAIDQHALTISSTSGGSVSIPGEGDFQYDHGTDVSIQATADSNDYFVNWTGMAVSAGKVMNPNAAATTVTVDADYTLQANFGESDGIAPTVTSRSPGVNDFQVPLNNLIILHVTDSGIGIDADTVEITLDGDTIYTGDASEYSSATGVCRRIGSPTDFTYAYQSNQPFDFDELKTVTVDAADLGGTAMTESYSFATEMRSFGQNKQVSSGLDNLNSDTSVTVCDSSGNIWAVWHAGPAGSRNIHVARLATGADTFGTSVQIRSNSSDQANPAIALGTDDKLYVVWQDNRQADDNNQGEWDIYVSTSVGGTSWSAERRINDPNEGNQINPAIVVDSNSPNHAHVVWQDDRAGNQDIRLATSSNGFVTKTVSQPITSDTSNQTAPAIAVDPSNTVYVLWTDARNATNDIYGAAGSGWANVPIVTKAADQSSPAIAVESAGSVLHMLWVDHTSGNSNIYYASSTGLPASPLAGSDLIDDNSSAEQLSPAIAVTGTGNSLKVFACWHDERNIFGGTGDIDLYMVQANPIAGTNIFVGDGGTSSNQSEPAIGTDKYGYPYLVWTDGRGTNTQTYYAGSTYMQSAPLASGLVTSASSVQTVGTDPASIAGVDDVSVSLPAWACPYDATIAITRIENPPDYALPLLNGYEFGPSGLVFNSPVTITIPYAVTGAAATPTVYWYNSRTGGLSQQGITDVEIIVMSSTLHALSFKTMHFTPFYLLGSAAVALDATAVNGSVTKTPDKVSYSYGETVTLHAVADTGYSFVDWSGDLSGSSNPATIVMASDKSITANFVVTTDLITGDFCGANFGPADGYIDVWDLMEFADHWHIRTGEGNWDATFDLAGPTFTDPDGYIDVWDLMMFADHWHEGVKP